MKFIPVCKCSLLGTIVNVDRLFNGACLYLLDDGSGLVDCVAWSNDDNNLYAVPALVPLPNKNCEWSTQFGVGDLVNVLGKIHCVSIGEVRKAQSFRNDKWEVHDCVREVHVNHIQKICAEERISWTAETSHWLDSSQFQTALKQTLPLQLLDAQFENCKSDDSKGIRNGSDVLDLLGPDICQQAVLHDDFPSADDASGAWRVFGASCRCRLGYMHSLLYCHCQATFERLDPQFVFRDRLLQTLLIMRDDHTKSKRGGVPFCFKYKTLANDERITRVAQNIVNDTEKVALNIQRLILRSFAALRTDGILYLMDDKSDTYMLICKENVMEPYIKTMMDSQAVEATYRHKFPLEELPAYLTNVPYERLHFVKRGVATQGGVGLS
jgi:hypothetical protein